MTRVEMVAVMARATGGSKAASGRALNALLASVSQTLAEGGRVSLGGFGTFVIGQRAARNGRDPRTGKVIRLPACQVPRFKASRVLKSAIR